jgi:glycosyltransferase involved in cell wall biosynthesis
MVSKKINLCFIFSDGEGWTGEVNYFNSLLSSLSYIKSKNVNFFVICSGKKKNILSTTVNKKNIIASKFFEKESIFWFLRKVFKFLFKKDFVLNYLIKKNNINVISHYEPVNNIASICWIPDLQHLFLKSFFPESEITRRDNLFKNYVNNASCIVVSSEDTREHLVQNYKIKNTKTYVLKFVPNIEFDEVKKFNFLKLKYKIQKNFIYVPNQFWKHKNHSVLIECAKLLKKKKFNANFVISGNPTDGYKNYIFDNFLNNINKNKLNKYFSILGFVPYSDVVNLIYHSKILINPSLFEGWSTTVEEGKIFNKQMILSRLNVHKEQCSNKALYFEANNSLLLSKLVMKLLKSKNKHLSLQEIKKNYKKSRILFAKNYLEIIKSVLK